MKPLNDEEIRNYHSLAVAAHCGKGAELARDLLKARELLTRCYGWVRFSHNPEDHDRLEAEVRAFLEGREQP